MRIWSKLPLRKQLYWLGSIAVLGVAVVILIAFGMSYRRMEASWRSMARDVAEQTRSHLDSWAQQAINSSNTLVFEGKVQDFLWAQDVYDYVDTYSDMDSTLHLYAEFQPILTDVALIGLRYDRKSRYIPVLTDDLPRASGLVPEFSSLLTAEDEKGEKRFVCISTLCKSTVEGRPLYTELGQVFLLVDVRTLADSIGLETGDSGFVRWIVDTDGTVIAAGDPDVVGSVADPGMLEGGTEWMGAVTYRDEPMIGCRLTHEPTGYSVVTLVPRTELNAMMTGSLSSQLVIIACMALLLVWLYATVTRSIYRPLQGITDYVRSISVGGSIRPRASLNLSGSMEMETLAGSVNAMLENIGDLTDELIDTHDRLHRAEMFKARSEMAMLVSQINPHFLYNTLESIKGMAYRVGAPQIVEMTKALGSIFRYSVKAPEMVTVGEEARILENYFAIQRTRFGDRFTMEVAVDPGVEDCAVPKMCLQPLCENAIYHGLEMKPTPGSLRVHAFARDGELIVTVEDDGLGMDADTLAQLRASLDEGLPAPGGSVHIGVANVHARIGLFFGRGYGLAIDSSPGAGTCVTLRIPVRSSSDV